MKSFILISASLLCSFSWISVSESQTVDVQPGEDVTLQCSNESHYDPLTFWFRLVDRATVRCISVLPRSASKPWFCNGYHKGSTDVTTNISTVFLKIKNVNISDSGMYFCGFYSNGDMNISVIHLNVQENADEKPEVMKVILVGLTVFLAMGMPIIITCLISVIKNLDSDDLNYTSVMFNPAASRRRELEPNGVFAATS